MSADDRRPASPAPEAGIGPSARAGTGSSSGADGAGLPGDGVTVGPRRFGWWLLPLFVAVGLAGAVLATALVVVVQNQRIEALRDETAAARAELDDAVEEVEAAAGDALAAIRDEVAAVRDSLATELPLPDAADAGVVHLRAEVPVGAPAVGAPASGSRLRPPATAVPVAAPGPDAPPDDPPDEDADPSGPDPTGPDPDGDDGTVDEPDDAPPPPPPPPATTVRTASGFVIARDADATFVLTTFALLADPGGGDRPLDRPVEVRTAAGTTTGRVHSWDAASDLLLIRLGAGGGLEPLTWRAEDRPLGPGDRVVAVGVTAGLTAVQVGAGVAAVTDAGLLTDAPPLRALGGGPVVDTDGEVVAMMSGSGASGEDPVAVPIRRVCGPLLASCPD